MQLPTKRTPPLTKITDYIVFIYGPPKVGKSTFCAKAPNVLFLATEPGLNSLDVFQIPISSWEELVEAYELLKAGQHDYQTVVIDTVDLALQFCAVWCRAKLGIVHESDAAYGKGFSFVKETFSCQMALFASLPYGLIFVSHAELKEVDTRAGKRTKIFPTVPGKARGVVVGMSDVILFADLIDIDGPDGKPVTQRVLRCAPTAEYEAGDRTGHLPDTLPLDYKAVVAAFAAGGVTMNPGSPQDLLDEICAKMDAAVDVGGIEGLAELWKSEACSWRADYPTGVGPALFEQVEGYKVQLKDAVAGVKMDPSDDIEEATLENYKRATEKNGKGKPQPRRTRPKDAKQAGEDDVPFGPNVGPAEPESTEDPDGDSMFENQEEARERFETAKPGSPDPRDEPDPEDSAFDKQFPKGQVDRQATKPEAKPKPKRKTRSDKGTSVGQSAADYARSVAEGMSKEGE